VIAALTRSRDLVRGAWLQVFGVLLVAVLVFSVLGGIIGAIAGLAGAADTLSTGAVPGTGFSIAIGLASVIVTTFATPYFAGLTGLLYVDQRIRRERYDLQLATWAAGR
jgi:ABC-type antimicrobial peptide transport system permease subunit